MQIGLYEPGNGRAGSDPLNCMRTVPFVVLLLCCTLILSAAAADTARPIAIQEPTAGMLPASRIVIDDAVKQATPYYVMLVGTEEEKGNLLGYIDRSPRSAEEKEAMKADLQGIWQKYPVEHVTETTAEGSVTRIAFDPAAGPGVALTGAENERLAEISRAIAEAFPTPAAGTPITVYDLSIWLVRTDGAGNELWNRTYRVGESSVVASVVQTDDSGFLIAATSRLREGAFDALLIRTDAQGNEIWRRTYGGPDWDNVLDMLRTSSGDYVVVGNTGWTPEAGTADAWILRVGPEGEERWSRTFSESGGHLLFSTVSETDGGGFILGGKKSSGQPKTDNACLLKVDGEGKEEWSRIIGGDDSGIVDDVILTSDGGYLAVLRNPLKAGSSGAVPLWLIKTDPSGEVLWTTTLEDAEGGSPAVVLRLPGGGRMAYLVACGTVLPGSELPKTRLVLAGDDGGILWSRFPATPEGMFMVTSAAAPSPGRYAFAGTVHFGGPEDGWLVLADSAGNVTSAHPFGGAAMDTISALSPTADSGYALAGTTRSFGENGRQATPGRAPGFGGLGAMAACGLAMLFICRRVMRE